MSMLCDFAKAGDLAKVQRRVLVAGDDVNGRDDPPQSGQLGMTALDWAAVKGHVEVVQFLLDNGADIDCRGSFGDTPLIRAAGNGQLEVVKLLLAAGADVNAKNNGGRTALYDAEGRRHSAVAVLLKAHGGTK